MVAPVVGVDQITMAKITPETSVKSVIKDYLNIKGVFNWYNLAGIGAQKGIPDMFALHKGVLYAIECKSAKGKVSDHQADFLVRVNRAGGVPIVARSLDDVMKHIK